MQAETVNPPEFSNLTTRVRLAQQMHVTVRSIGNYHALALDCVDDYYDDFPKILGQRVTNFRLSQYQCWVLWKLKILIGVTQNSNAIKQALINDLDSQKQLSKHQFFIEYHCEVNTNEFEGILPSK